jgi:hypothetical protein
MFTLKDLLADQRAPHRVFNVMDSTHR